MKASLAFVTAVVGIGAAAPASAAQYMFQFNGLGRSASGTLTTADTPSALARNGYTAFEITGITGTITVGTGSPLAIIGLNGFTGSDNLYYTTGPSFLDGSGLGFTAAGGAQTSLFFQDFSGLYKITTLVGGFGAGTVTASSSAVAAVPEPATWAMMVLGFATLGAALRYRNVRPTLGHA